MLETAWVVALRLPPVARGVCTRVGVVACPSSPARGVVCEMAVVADMRLVFSFILHMAHFLQALFWLLSLSSHLLLLLPLSLLLSLLLSLSLVSSLLSPLVSSLLVPVPLVSLPSSPPVPEWSSSLVGALGHSWL